MVPIKEAISSGAWLHFSNEDESVQFRLRAIAFRKVDLTEIDNPENIKAIDGNTQWRILEIEVINLSKKNIYSSDGPGKILLSDHDGYQFTVTYDEHLWRRSELGKRLGLKRFYFEILIPKTKAVGAIAFLLPDDDEAEYSLSLKNGTVREA